MKKLFRKVKEMRVENMIAFLALTVATVSANSACTYWIYQEQESDEVKKLRKF